MAGMFPSCVASALCLAAGLSAAPAADNSVSASRRLNNLAAVLLDVVPAPDAKSFRFVRPSDGWIFVSLTTRGEGTIRLTLDNAAKGESPINSIPATAPTQEAMHHVAPGPHTLDIERIGGISIEHLTVKAIPELMHCGLGFDPQIKAYGPYDMEFLRRDILPNITTLIVPNQIKLEDQVVQEWRRQGKRF